MTPERYRLILECLFQFYCTMFSHEVIERELAKAGLPAHIEIQDIPDSKLQVLTDRLRRLSRSPSGT